MHLDEFALWLFYVRWKTVKLHRNVVRASSPRRRKQPLKNVVVAILHVQLYI